MFAGTLPSGTNLQHVIAWVDGINRADRKTKVALTHTTSTQDVLKHGGQYVSFNGTTTRINCGSQLIGTGDVTIFAWITPSSYGEGNNGRIADNGKFIFAISSTSERATLTYDGATLCVSADSSIAVDTEYFVCGTMASGGGSTGNIYINGVLSGSADQDVGTAESGSTNLHIGNNNLFNGTFAGLICPVIIFNKVLTPTQIMQYYNKFR